VSILLSVHCVREERGRPGSKVIKKTTKATLALGRKFLGIIYRTLENKWVFADFLNFVLAEEATASTLKIVRA
jgi:hypothetical protein